jgi:1,4-dihydroxy-2-naphthoate octaprenyltransferase
LPPGLLGVVIILTYTRWLNRSPLLCLIAPGLAFGPLMVLGTEFALTGHYTPTTSLLALIPFFLVNNLLLLNQFPDVDADRRAGRYHLLIALGPQRSAGVLLLQAAAAELLLLGAVAAGLLPVLTLLALLPLSLALLAGVGAWRYGNTIPRLLPFMGINVLAVVATPVLLALGLLL